MSNEELINQFDVVLSTFLLNVSYGEEQGRRDYSFDEYEKSVFLTQAQESLTKSLYNEFETNEIVREYLNTLIKTSSLSIDSDISQEGGISSMSIRIKLPKDVLAILYEGVNFNTDSKLSTLAKATKLKEDDKCLADNINSNELLSEENSNAENPNHINYLWGEYAEVVPIKLDDLYRTLHNPFKGPTKKRVLRVERDFANITDNSSDTAITYPVRTVELISKYPIDSYVIRYLSYPTPIVLIDLPDGLSVHGETTETAPILPESLHETLLKTAVQLALQSRVRQSSKED